jgi:hypothetical protein
VRAGPGLPVEVAGARLRRLLLRLALDPGRVVTSAQLVDAVWDDHPPAGAANALQTLVSRLRRLLPGVLESSPSGYRLAVDAEAVDAVRFEALALAGRQQLGRDPDRARALLGEALALWRGPALADAATAAFAEPAVARLDGLRLQAVEDRVEADLAAGATDRLVAELEELVAATRCPTALGGQLVRALPAGPRPTPSGAATRGCGPGWPTSSASTRHRSSRRSMWPCSAASWPRRRRPPPAGRRPNPPTARPWPAPTSARRSPASSAAATTSPGSWRRSPGPGW